MKLDSPTDVSAVRSDTEKVLGIRYPTAAPQLLAELSSIVGSSRHHGVLEHARLLVTPTDVSEPRDEVGGRLVDGYALPFMIDEQGQ